MEEPHDLDAISGLDGMVELMWSSPVGPASVFLDETFDDGLSDSWTIVDGGDAGFTWEWVESYDGQTLDGTPFVYCDADAAGTSDGYNTTSWFDDELITPELPTSGAELYLFFDHLYMDYSVDNVASTANVDVWDGNEWVNVAGWSENGGSVGSWSMADEQIIDVSEYANSNFRVRFHYLTDPASWEWYWAVDNIKITNFLEDGRYSINYELTETGWEVSQSPKDEMRELIINGIWPDHYIDYSTFEIIDNSDALGSLNRDVPVTAYNIYRTIDGTYIEMIASVGPDVLTYMDEDVINGTT
jgi:hypothetical protein